MIANTPQPPYYAVIFTSTRTEGDNGYASMADTMEELAKQQPGYLGIESARSKIGVTVSYWDSLEAIKNWRQNAEHLLAQKLGREQWYASFKTRICKVERDYGMQKEMSQDLAAYNKELEEAVKRVDAGHFYTQGEVEKMSKEW